MTDDTEKARRAVLHDLINIGLSPRDARVVIDLTVHACAEMQKAGIRVVKAAPEELQLFVTILAAKQMVDLFSQGITSIVERVKSS